MQKKRQFPPMTLQLNPTFSGLSARLAARIEISPKNGIENSRLIYQ
ncbi:hypothetical protein [Methylomonas sp. DH-1]|nr:hypothetical protein [Methylomonas sp. DH-1]